MVQIQTLALSSVCSIVDSVSQGFLSSTQGQDITNLFVPVSHDTTDKRDKCSGIGTSESAPSCLGDKLDISPVLNDHFIEAFDSDYTKTKPNTAPTSLHSNDMGTCSRIFESDDDNRMDFSPVVSVVPPKSAIILLGMVQIQTPAHSSVGSIADSVSQGFLTKMQGRDMVHVFYTKQRTGKNIFTVNMVGLGTCPRFHICADWHQLALSHPKISPPAQLRFC
jgi:hypothetical protein